MQVNWQPGKTGGQLVQTVEQAKLIHRSHGPRFESGIAHINNIKQYNDMKAIKVSVDYHEWSKVEAFLDRFENDDDTFTYMVDNVTFVAVFDGECAMAYFKAELAGAFEDEVIIVELR